MDRLAPTPLAADLAAAALDARPAVRRRAPRCGASSPRWPAHGRHVAVEFVHPVIVGKRALPAVYVDGGDIVGAVRLLARPGDIVLAIGPADRRSLGALLRRSQPWGLTSVWLGAGPRPPAGAPTTSSGSTTPTRTVAARSGDVVMLYHLLWELTHVVFEHPGLLRRRAGVHRRRVHHVLRRGPAGRGRDRPRRRPCRSRGRRGARDRRRQPGRPGQPGDLVLVHAGVALTVLPRKRRT